MKIKINEISRHLQLQLDHKNTAQVLDSVSHSKI